MKIRNIIIAAGTGLVLTAAAASAGQKTLPHWSPHYPPVLGTLISLGAGADANAGAPVICEVPNSSGSGEMISLVTQSAEDCNAVGGRAS